MLAPKCTRVWNAVRNVSRRLSDLTRVQPIWTRQRPAADWRLLLGTPEAEDGASRLLSASASPPTHSSARSASAARTGRRAAFLASACRVHVSIGALNTHPTTQAIRWPQCSLLSSPVKAAPRRRVLSQTTGCSPSLDYEYSAYRF